LIEGVLVSIVGVLIVGGIILLIVLILRKKRKNEKKRKDEQELNENNSMIQQTLELSNTTNEKQQSELSTLNPFLLQRSQISFSTLTIEKEIGEGSYGKMCLGKWNAAPVALKFCKKKGKIEDFMREIKLMMYVSI
jgi:hypothetical protein